MPKPSRFRGITLKLSLATCLVGPSVGAQTPSPKSGAAAGDSGDTVPRGASGALVVPPKTEAPAPAPSAPVVKPPVIKVDDGAQYPRDALKAGVRDSVTVILILEIGADGHVRKATIDGAQGDGASASLFEAAALEAAQKIQAEPATKNGVPVVSRVKHRYDFKPPPGRLVDGSSTRRPAWASQTWPFG